MGESKMVIYKKELDDKIGEFLKKNAIIPYNDAVADYLDFYINEEAQKDGRVRDSSKIEKLRRSKASYEQERTILDKTLSGELKAAGKIPTTEEVKGMIDSLFKLKHFGKDINGVFNSLEKGEKLHRNFNQVNVNSLANRGRSKSKRAKGIGGWMLDKAKGVYEYMQEELGLAAQDGNLAPAWKAVK